MPPFEASPGDLWRFLFPDTLPSRLYRVAVAIIWLASLVVIVGIGKERMAADQRRGELKKLSSVGQLCHVCQRPATRSQAYSGAGWAVYYFCDAHDPPSTMMGRATSVESTEFGDAFFPFVLGFFYLVWFCQALKAAFQQVTNENMPLGWALIGLGFVLVLHWSIGGLFPSA